MHRIPIRILALASLALPVVFALPGVTIASASRGLAITKLVPNSAPEFTAVPVKIVGSGFDTTPGATTVSFGGTPAEDVNCKSSRVCTVVTPFIADGPVEVTVTVGEVTSNPLEFLSEVYRPPLVSIEPVRGSFEFAETRLTDRYAAIFTPGNVYLQIKNSTLTSQTITGPTGPVTLEPGEIEGYNVPVQEATPYEFTLEGAAKPAKGKLTVKTKAPA
jgi:hypothetical protein